MSGQSDRGIMFVVSAPSGAGKSTLSRRLLAETDGIRFSVSYTTRPRRPGEQDGKHYHFVDRTGFERMVQERRFLEWAEVHGERYGTGREETERALEEGGDLLLDIDVQGARHVRESGIDAVYVFILPPDFTTLEARLRARSREDGGSVDHRLAIAGREAAEFSLYDYLVINDEVDRAVADLRSIVRSERRRALRCRREAERILKTIPGA